MPLKLTYIINQGIPVSEKIISRDTGEKFQETIDIIVRSINLFQEGVKVDFELRDLNGNSELIRLREGERHDVTSLCTLHLPRYPLIRKCPSRKNRVFLKFYAPREVEFGERKMYD